MASAARADSSLSAFSDVSPTLPRADCTMGSPAVALTFGDILADVSSDLSSKDGHAASTKSKSLTAGSAFAGVASTVISKISEAVDGARDHKESAFTDVSATGPSKGPRESAFTDVSQTGPLKAARESAFTDVSCNDTGAVTKGTVESSCSVQEVGVNLGDRSQPEVIHSRIDYISHTINSVDDRLYKLATVLAKEVERIETTLSSTIQESLLRLDSLEVVVNQVATDVKSMAATSGAGTEPQHAASDDLLEIRTCTLSTLPQDDVAPGLAVASGCPLSVLPQHVASGKPAAEKHLGDKINEVRARCEVLEQVAEDSMKQEWTKIDGVDKLHNELMRRLQRHEAQITKLGDLERLVEEKVLQHIKSELQKLPSVVRQELRSTYMQAPRVVVTRVPSRSPSPVMRSSTPHMEANLRSPLPAPRNSLLESWSIRPPTVIDAVLASPKSPSQELRPVCSPMIPGVQQGLRMPFLESCSIRAPTVIDAAPRSPLLERRPTCSPIIPRVQQVSRDSSLSSRSSIPRREVAQNVSILFRSGSASSISARSSFGSGSNPIRSQCFPGAPPPVSGVRSAAHGTCIRAWSQREVSRIPV